ncbi:MAG: polysaccharide deacetylase [Lachnospiraceae bacterium]|nr:polysaccharide deacetylase [Lachnospiraceae bacterium]
MARENNRNPRRKERAQNPDERRGVRAGTAGRADRAGTGKPRMSDEEREELRAERRRQRERDMRRHLIISSVLVTLILAAAVTGIAIVSRNKKINNSAKAEKAAEIAAEEAEIAARRNSIADAEKMAEGYDYDGAIAMLQAEKDYDTDGELINAIARFTAEKSTLEAKDPLTVPHIFYQSLIVDPDRIFSPGHFSDAIVGANNAFMATADEFDSVTQQMYDRGWVLVRMRDLVTETTDSDGTVHLKKNTSLMLPADKKPYVLSVDDLAYHHSLEGKGFADKLVVTGSGEVKAQYTDANGNVSTGDYDVVPKLDAFIKAHPDAAYRGARGMLALSGYDGVFGYRTDTAYKTGKKLDKPQKKWLEAHPDFNWDKEVQDAKKVADALRAGGWEFACNTWGHVIVSDKTVDELKTDHEKWKNTVAPIAGETDTIIFSNGGDVGTWRNYDENANPAYGYYKSEGYHFYGIVDNTSESWIQIQDDYLRQGRIAVNGLQMWRVMSGTAKKNVFEQLFDIESVFDSRRPTPVSATGR